jgi:hypothetical protein
MFLVDLLRTRQRRPRSSCAVLGRSWAEIPARKIEYCRFPLFHSVPPCKCQDTASYCIASCSLFTDTYHLKIFRLARTEVAMWDKDKPVLLNVIIIAAFEKRAVLTLQVRSVENLDIYKKCCAWQHITFVGKLFKLQGQSVRARNILR